MLWRPVGLEAAGRPNHAGGRVADTMPNDDQRAARQMNMPLRGGVPLITSTALNLLVLPVLALRYGMFENRPRMLPLLPLVEQ